MVPTDPSERSTRRSLLRRGAGLLATGGTAAVAGCLSGLPPLGSRQSYGRLAVPPPDPPTYRRWLPAPTPDVRHAGTLLYAEPGGVTGGEPEEFLGRRALTKPRFDHFGVGYENYDAVVDTAYGAAIEGPFERGAVADALVGSGYEPDGSYRGYDLFARSDVPRRAAVRDGVVVWSSARVHERPDVAVLIDAAAGDRRRYHEASPGFERLSQAVGASRLVMAGPEVGGDRAGATEVGADAFRFDDGAAYQVLTLLFPPNRVPSVDSLERAYRDAYRWTEEADAFDVGVEGRLASLETRVQRGDDGRVSPFDDPPQVTWGATYDPEERTVTFRHEAGPAVDADLLWADVDADGLAPGRIEEVPLWTGVDRVVDGGTDGATAAVEGAPARTAGGQVGPGDTATVDLTDRPEATAVDLLLTRAGCCEFVHLFRYELGEER